MSVDHWNLCPWSVACSIPGRFGFWIRWATAIHEIVLKVSRTLLSCFAELKKCRTMLRGFMQNHAGPKNTWQEKQALDSARGGWGAGYLASRNQMGSSLTSPKYIDKLENWALTNEEQKFVNYKIKYFPWLFADIKDSLALLSASIMPSDSTMLVCSQSAGVLFTSPIN